MQVYLTCNINYFKLLISNGNESNMHQGSLLILNTEDLFCTKVKKKTIRLIKKQKKTDRGLGLTVIVKIINKKQITTNKNKNKKRKRENKLPIDSKGQR